MRSFVVVFGLVATALAAPVRRALTTSLTEVPGVSDAVNVVSSAVGPVEGAAVPVLNTVQGVPVVGGLVKGVVDGAVGALSNVRRALTSELENIPGVSDVVNVVSSAVGPVEGAAAPVLTTVDDVPVVGGLVKGVVDGAVGALSNLRRALTSELENIPGTSDVVNVVSSAVGPVEGAAAPVLNTVQGVPVVGGLVKGIVDGAVGALSNL